MVTEVLLSKALPFTDYPNLVREYSHYFQDSNSPLVENDIKLLRVLGSDTSRKIWKPDIVRFALEEFYREFKINKHKAEADFFSMVASACQVMASPRFFLRRIEQLRPSLYPNQLLHDCSLTIDYSGSLHLLPIQIKEVQDFAYQQQFQSVTRWLNSLPFEREEMVYVASKPEETFVMPWEVLAEHWDAFYHDNWCSINVIDDDPRWFLWMHYDEIAIWGCTEEYAAENGMKENKFLPQPISYKQEFKRVLQSRSQRQTDLRTYAVDGS